MPIGRPSKIICQLPKPYSPSYIEEGEWISISRKMNGVHAIFKDGNLYTRERRIIPGCEHLLEDCWRLNEAMGGTNSNPYIIEGELLIKGEESDFEDEFDRFTQTCSLVGNLDPDKSALEMHIFDAVSYEEYTNIPDMETSAYTLRREPLVDAYEAIADEIENLKLIPHLYEGYDQTKIEEWFKYSEAQGWEGIVINRDLPYLRSKNNNVLKYKHKHTADLKIVDFKPGTGRYKGSLGAIMVEYKGNMVAVGSGMDIPTREWIWTHRPELLGRVVEVQYQCKTKSKSGTESLQFPVYVCIRPEGKEVNEGD